MVSPNKSRNSTFVEELRYSYLPFWPLLIALSLLFGLCALVYARYVTPVYEATATLLIKDEKKGSEEGQLSESLNFLNSKKIVENEVVVIQSRNLVDAVVNSLRLYAPVYEVGKVSDRPAYESSPVMITAYNLEQLKPHNKIPFRYEAATKKVIIEGTSYDLDRSVVTPYGALIFSANPHFKTATERQLYFSLLPPRKVSAALSKKLEVTPTGKLSSIVKLKLKDEVPQRAEDILNALINKYNNASIEYKNDLAKNTIEFVEERMRIVQRELNVVEKNIQNLKTQKGIVDLSEQGKLYLQNVGENDQKLSQINMSLSVLDQVEKYVSTKENTEGIVPSTLGVDDPVLSGLLDKLYQAELERERLKKTTAENNPVMVAINDQIEKIRPSILENIRSQRNGLFASRRNISLTNATYSSVLQTIPQKERELLDVSRQQSIKNGIYSFLLQKREETAIAFASNIADSKLIESAQASPVPVSPNKLLLVLIALILAVISTLAYVVFREKFSRNILFRSEIESLTSVPVMAELPQFKNVSRTGTNTIVEEQFRQLSVAAGLLSKASDRKKIAITSSTVGEGKSFISWELARSLALAGKKVLLADFDLKNPASNPYLGNFAGKGIADYLEGKTELGAIITNTDQKNLFVINRGVPASNATALLLNDRTALLFDALEKDFDFIILNCAAVTGSTDAYLLSEHCDLTLYVVRHGQTPKFFLKNLDETNANKPLNHLFLLFNGIKPRGFVKNNFGYGYGYSIQYSAGIKKEGLKNTLTNLPTSFRKPSAKKA